MSKFRVQFRPMGYEYKWSNLSDKIWDTRQEAEAEAKYASQRDFQTFGAAKWIYQIIDNVTDAEAEMINPVVWRLEQGIRSREERLKELKIEREKYVGTLNAKLSRISAEGAVLEVELKVLKEVRDG